MEDFDLIALCSIPEIGPITVRRLLAAFGTPSAVFKASERELRAVEGIDEKRAKAIKAFDGGEKLQKDMSRLAAEGVGVATIGSEDYPEPLRGLPDAPLVLYMRGRAVKEDRYAIAVVGSRGATHYGIAVAERMSGELSSMGFAIVSGLARGIDTAAHRAALSGGGRGIAVLGSGIDVPYPPENRGLMERLAASGYVVSEFPPGMPPRRENFPRRNRLISGLSLGVLVVEAAEKSGALITAQYALDQGREVFSIPGNINSSASSGTNRLIRQGARPVLRAEDIVEELAPVLRGFIKSKEKVKIPVSGEEKALCDIMSGEPKHVDVISRQSGMAAQKVLAILLGLELKGVVRQSEGKRFYLA